MDCIFEDYIKFTTNFLTNYYRILLDKKYERKYVKPFIDKYIDVRYYNKYVVKSKDFITRLNKELNNLAKEMIEENKKDEEKIKNNFALFSYILFIDGCLKCNNISILLKTLFADKKITIEYADNVKSDLEFLVNDYIEKKNDFFHLFSSEEFYFKEKNYGNVTVVNLEQKCIISKLYSEYAIDKAYNSEIVVENRTFLSILLLSSRVIKEVIDLNFDHNYIMEFPVSLFEKNKKIIKYLRALDDDMLKSRIILNFKYKDYKIYKRDIRDLINQGYGISLELDEEYDINFDDLFMFSYILLDKKYKYYDIIINSKEDVKTNMITL